MITVPTPRGDLEVSPKEVAVAHARLQRPAAERPDVERAQRILQRRNSRRAAAIIAAVAAAAALIAPSVAA